MRLIKPLLPWGSYASNKASATQLSTTPPARGPPAFTERVVGDRAPTSLCGAQLDEETRKRTLETNDVTSLHQDDRTWRHVYRSAAVIVVHSLQSSGPVETNSTGRESGTGSAQTFSTIISSQCRLDSSENDDDDMVEQPYGEGGVVTGTGGGCRWESLATSLHTGDLGVTVVHH